MFVLELIKRAFLACCKLATKTLTPLRVRVCNNMFAWVRVCVFSTAYSIQGQNVQIISPSSESHQQVVAVGQPLTAQPQGTVVVRTHTFGRLGGYILDKCNRFSHFNLCSSFPKTKLTSVFYQNKLD